MRIAFYVKVIPWILFLAVGIIGKFLLCSVPFPKSDCRSRSSWAALQRSADFPSGRRNHGTCRGIHRIITGATRAKDGSSNKDAADNDRCYQPRRIRRRQRVVFTIGVPVTAVFDRVGGKEAADGGVVVPVPQKLKPGRIRLVAKRPAVAKPALERPH